MTTFDCEYALLCRKWSISELTHSSIALVYIQLFVGKILVEKP